MSAFSEETSAAAAEHVAALEALGFTVTLDPPLGGAEEGGEPTEADFAVCAPFSGIARTVDQPELIRLLRVFANHPNVRWPQKPEVNSIDKVVMAIRRCSSVIKKRQDDAVAAGAVPLLVSVLTGCHLEDRETCLRTTQCIMGVANKNAAACAAFRDAGAEDALRAIIEKHSNKPVKDMEDALEIISNTVE